VSKLDETSLFTSFEPRRNRCTLCASQAGPFQLESRPTGPGGRLQAWPWCAACWKLASGPGVVDPAGLLHLLLAIFEPEKLAGIPGRAGEGRESVRRNKT
jgi:hypothetical protein